MIGFVVMKAEDQSIIKANGKILIIVIYSYNDLLSQKNTQNKQILSWVVLIFKYQLTSDMNFKKTILLISILFPLNACVQSTAFMGPGVTIATSGNIAQAGFQYGTNKIIEKQTGKNTLSLIADAIEENKKEKEKNQNSFDEKKFQDDFKKLVEKNFYKTRKQIFYN